MIGVSLRGNTQDSMYLRAMPLSDGKVSYERIFQIDSSSKLAIFGKVKDWAVDSYRSQKATLESEDKEIGYIAYKGFLPTILKYEGGLLKGKPYEVQVWHTLKFYIKDGKVRMLFTDLQIVSRDVTSVYIGETTRLPIEEWETYIIKRPKKKQADTREMYERSALSMDLQIKSFLDKAIKDISTKKSGFDF